MKNKRRSFKQKAKSTLRVWTTFVLCLVIVGLPMPGCDPMEAWTVAAAEDVSTQPVLENGGDASAKPADSNRTEVKASGEDA